MSDPQFIYKIATADIVENARKSGVFIGMPIDTADGFLHFSTAAQLAETLKLHFRGQSGLVVLALPTAGLGPLRWEPSRGGALFPHLYGTFLMSAVAHEAIIDVAADGAVSLPAWIK